MMPVSMPELVAASSVSPSSSVSGCKRLTSKSRNCRERREASIFQPSMASTQQVRHQGQQAPLDLFGEREYCILFHC